MFARACDLRLFRSRRHRGIFRTTSQRMGENGQVGYRREHWRSRGRGTALAIVGTVQARCAAPVRWARIHAGLHER